MKVLWLCNYSLKYLDHILNLNIDYSKKHPVPWLFYLVKEISKHSNIELHLITLQNLVDRDHTLKENGIHYHIIKEKSLFIPTYEKGKLRKKKLYGANILWKRKVLNLINDIKPDIINIHGTEGELQVLANKLNYPVVVWMQGLMNQVTKVQDSTKYKYWLENENEILTKQNHFITFPGEMEEFISKVNSNAKFYNIYHPNPEYAFDMFNINVRKTADLVFVGEIIKRKGIEDFLNLICSLKDKRTDIKAKIIGFTGNNEYLTSVKYLIKRLGIENNVNFVGYLPDHYDVLMEIKKSKVFVLPTYVDSGPRSVAESMTVGVPVVSHNIDGLPEMIKSGYSGILVEPGDMKNLIKETNDLLNDNAKIKYISENAYNTALSKYSPRKVVEQLASLYQNIIDESKKVLA